MEPKTIIVTGATSGIGKGVAIYFASKGINVVAAGRREDLGKSLVEEIKEVMERRKERIAELRAEIERIEQDNVSLENTIGELLKGF